MVSDCLNMASLLTFHAPSLLSYSVIILSAFAPCCSRQADYPPNIFSKASDNAVTCIQPIFHFNWDNGAWKTWPHTCFTFIFDLIMQIDFERMCHQRMQHKYRKKKKKRIVCLLESLLAAELASHFSSLQKISYLFLPPNKRHSAEGFA